MRVKLLTLALTAALAQPALASDEHNHSIGSDHSGPAHIDIGPVQSEFDDMYLEYLNSQKPKLRAAQNSVLANQAGIVEIDVAVVLHQQYIDQMKENLFKDKNGKFYENGAQFAVERVKAQFDYFNKSLEKQGLKGRFNPVYFTVVNHIIEKSVSVTDATDFNNLRTCVVSPDFYIDQQGKREYCSSGAFGIAREATNSKVDTMLYIRPYIEDEPVVGWGGFRSIAYAGDRYIQTGKELLASGNNYPDAVFESLRFGHYNAQVMIHEFGHVLAAGHEISEAQPVYADSYGRAYSCGRKLNIATGEYSTSKKRETIMYTGASIVTEPSHDFFSDPNLFVDGDACGEAGVADNKKYVAENLPVIAAQYEPPVKASNVFFVQSELIFNRTEGKGTITLRRTGDLTQPAYINVIASDDTAWEQRDFDFGLKEVAFAAGESEKTVEFTMLERTGGHADTQFSVKMIGAMNASFASEPLTVKIVSDKPVQNGQVGFKDSQITTAEGNVVEVLLTRTNGTDGDATFNVTTANGTGVAGVDYKAVSQAVTIKNGESSASVLIETTNRAGSQGARTVLLNIESVTGATAGTTQATLTINDALQYGTVGFTATTVTATESGPATLNITRTNGSDGAVSVNVKTVSGTAVAGTDFTALDQTVNFAEGQTTASVTVPLINRTGSQGSRSFSVEISNPAGGVAVGTSVATVTIADASGQSGQGSSEGGSSGGSTSIWFILSLFLVSLVRRRY